MLSMIMLNGSRFPYNDVHKCFLHTSNSLVIIAVVVVDGDDNDVDNDDRRTSGN